MSTDKSHERHRLYMQANPERRCWKCAKDLNRHTVAEFHHCEFLLATSGQETMVMNRPDIAPTDGCDAGYACDRDDIDLTMKQPLDPKW